MAIEPSAWNRIQAKLSSLSREDFSAAFDDIFREPVENDRTSSYKLDSNGVAHFDAIGVASKAGPDVWDWFMGVEGFSTSLLTAQLQHAKTNSSVRGAFLRVSSPGGTVSGTQAAADAVREFAAVKPLVVFAEDITASAAYWIASGASKIITTKTSEIGSIGVFAVMPDFSRMVENAGVEFHLVKSAPRKGDGSFGVKVTKEAIDDTQRIVDDLHSIFVADVARNRGMKIKWGRDNPGAQSVPDDGRVWLGEEAVALGLADAIGTPEDALSSIHSLISSNSIRRLQTTMGKVAEALSLQADADEDQIVDALAARVEARAQELASAKEAAARATADRLVKEATEKAEAERREVALTSFVAQLAADGLIKSCQVESANTLVRASEDAFRAFVAENRVSVPVAARIKTEGPVAPAVSFDPVTPEGRIALDKRAKEIAAERSISYSAAMTIAYNESRKGN